METLTTAIHEFEISNIKAHYQKDREHVSFDAFDLEGQKAYDGQCISFLELALAICPDGKGNVEVGLLYHSFDEDSGPTIDRLPISLTPFEFFAEIFEAGDTEYRMKPEQKKEYMGLIEDALQPIMKERLNRLK